MHLKNIIHTFILFILLTGGDLPLLISILQAYVCFLEINSHDEATQRLIKVAEHMDGMEYKGSVMKMSPGRDLTKGEDLDLLSLDCHLLDADVVNIIRNCHAELLKDDTIFTDEDVRNMFFRSDRNEDSIRALFEE